ncbi:hypothetical protein L1987_51334 [Smallanthus sonchifolius]|uniref:Uncharacterized protein n=1 Tax=Smallanthus sonchifolius TaxID=185202 RepID=A0ACB9EQB5_9ASTR|nr:hypothetical protein L1987_51334 [Smallanthus sonchifolius]
MASALLLSTQITVFLLLISLTRFSRADVGTADPTTDLSLHLAADELDWSTSTMSMSTMSMYGIDDVETEDGGDASTAGGRRSLFWQRMRYYISYGALSANRVPCPPRSGRSYYTHDCWRARGPVRPYTRGCSAITRCRR